MKQKISEIVSETSGDPNQVQEQLQAEALRHPFLRRMIQAYLSRLGRRMGPANLVGVVFSL